MRKRNIALIAAAVSVSTVALVTWLYRTSIVTRFVDQALAERGVAARYQIEQIGLGRQRLRNIVVGNPDNPDLIIDRLDLSVVLGIDGPRIAAVAIDGAMLRGRLTDSGISFGAVDRLIPPDDGTPFALPDMHLSLRRAAMSVQSPWGHIAVGASGSGQLKQRFIGHVAARADTLADGDCRADRAIARLRISIDEEIPKFVGPVGADAVRCSDSGFSIADVRLGIDGQLNRRLDAIALNSRLRTGAAAVPRYSLTSLSGTLSGAGQLGGRLQSQWTVRGVAPQSPWVTAADIVAEGTANRDPAGTVSARATLRSGNVRGGEDILAAAGQLRSTGAGTPIQPLLVQLANALTQAGAGASVTANLRADQAASGPLRVAMGEVRADARSGAFVHLSGEDVVVADTGGTRLALNGRFGGGGLPDGFVNARSSGATPLALDGSIRIAPMVADDARLALAPIRFQSDGRGGTRFVTAARLSGPINTGYLDGLSLPINGGIDGAGTLSLSGRCQPVGWDGIRAGDTYISAGTIRLCGLDEVAMLRVGPRGVEGGVRVGPTQLRGRVGDQPMLVTLGGGQANVGDGSFSIDDLGLSLGGGAQPTRLVVDALQGDSTPSGITGRFEGLSASLASVPLLLGNSAGDWRWADSALTMTASLIVSDRATDARFNPLLSNDATLRFADGRIAVRGTLLEPASRAAIASVDITHQLDGQRGEARINVDELRFRPNALQPATLSRLGLGVIADANGTVRGTGVVRWADGDVTSQGQFSTDELDFAAAFGPVRGLRGTINFSDLLALESPPNQQLRVASINPGIEVTDGTIALQLLPDNRVQVESGEWPFSGGQLRLRPTVLDFDVSRARALTFDLVGVDAGLFLARFEFDNINATGVFDGTIPTVFDANGGRIVDGALRSRDGGSLSYLGELTYRDLGYFGNIAFGALRSIRYDDLAIRLNGQIDGDMVTEVDFAGLSQGADVDNNILTRAIRSLPVVFRIRMNAPFRSLLTSARGLYDPTLLIEQNLPALLRAQREREAAQAAERDRGVQPGVSEDEQ